jgi:hypothetical protein
MIQVIKSGKEPVIRGAVDWLEALGVPVRLIRSMEIIGEVGSPARVIVELFVDTPDELADQDA